MTYYGQFNSDKILSEVYFPNQETGNCIEVGAVDGFDHSNTLHFEQKGWNCLCIEPQPEYFAVLQKSRKQALNFAIASKEEDEVVFKQVFCKPNNSNLYYPWNGMSGLDLDSRLLEEHAKMGLEPIVKEIKVRTKRLDWCIDNYFKHDTIDFISIDTEGSELDVLKSFDVKKYNIKVMIIENNFNEPYVEDYLRMFDWKKDRREGVNDFYVKV